MAETDYNEILLEAIDAIVVSRISEVNFDRTIVATIVDASKAKDGEYVLSDGSVQFTVRNGSDKYKENDRVNVLIPSNDFSSTEKTILGKTSANVNDVPVTYVSPLEKIVPMETNYAAGLKGGIIANSETEIVQLTNAEWIEVNESTLGYDTLCVSARFKTLLNDYDIRQGHYGLLVQLKTKNGYVHALTLDSAKDMFGNPYGYAMYLTQEQTYHLNLQDNIIGIKIDLYQMKDFKYNDGVKSELQVLPVMPYSNILVDNINVSFGYNAEQVEDNTAKISTADSLTYNNIKDASVTKKLTLTWYNKDENNKYLGFSDGHFAGQDKDNPLYEIKWYHSQNNGEWALLSDFNDATIANVEMNLRWAINEYKAIVTYDGNEYSSNILSFKAETGYDSNIHDQLNMELELRNGKDSLDSYPFYGADSAVINPGDASKNREIEFVYSGALGSKLESDVLNGAIVSFYIPTISTMLNLPFGLEDEELQKESDLEGYALYQKEFSSYSEDNKQQLKTFRYRVKEFYNPLFNNNTVILKVIDKNGFEYSAKKTFSFSSYGTSGTDYTLVIEDPINKKATLYDADYKVIKTEFEDKDWSYWPSSIRTGTPTAAASYAVRKLSTVVKWVGKTVTLEAIKGIPWYPENSNYYYQGPTTIIYDSAGVNPRYYVGDIGLYDKSTNEPIVGLTWTLRYYPKNKLIKDPQTSISVQGYPQLLIDESGTKAPKLKVPNMYFDQDYYLVLVANNSNGQAQWRQPLIILQNAYSSNLLNNWNGALSVDQGNNTILSAMIGAGSKDSNNRFSGVVMGDLEKLDGNGSILNSEHGLLGFHNGVQSFGFRTNGTAFLGKSDKGRIEFNGDGGFIQSANFVSGASGTKLDLDDGTLELHNSTQDNHFVFNENGLDIRVNQFSITSNQIGGNNLLKNTNQPRNQQWHFWASGGDGSLSLKSLENTDTTIETTILNTHTNSPSHFARYTISIEELQMLEKGENYTLSFDLKPSIDATVTCSIQPDAGGANVDYTQEVSREARANIWNKMVFVLTRNWVNINTNTSAQGLKFNFGNLTAASSYVIKNLKLEKGNIATVWSPAADESVTTSKLTIEANKISGQVSNLSDNFNSYQEQTAEGFKNIALGMAGHYGTCDTADGTYPKWVKLTNADIFPAITEDEYPEGTTLAVTFEYANTIKGYFSLGPLRDKDSGGNEAVWYRGNETSGTNYFLWNAGDTVFFVYSNGHWNISETGTYSQIVQTGKQITQTVKDTKEDLQSQIDQKPDSITLSVSSTKVGKNSGPTITLKYTDANGKETEGGTGTITLDGNVVFTSSLQDNTTVISGGNIKTGALVIKDNNNTIFKADVDSGKVDIAGFTVDNNSIFSGSWTPGGAAATIFMSTGTNSKYNICGVNQNNWVLGSGNKFGVDKNGALYSTSGKIGGWDIQPWGIEQLTDDDMLVAGFYSDFAASKRGNFTVGSKTSSDWRLLIYGNFGVTAQGALYATEGEIGSLKIGTNGLGFLSRDNKTSSTYITRHSINTGNLNVGRISFDSYGDDALEIFNSQALYFGALYDGNAPDEEHAVSIGAGGISLYALHSGVRSKTISWTDFFNKF